MRAPRSVVLIGVMALLATSWAAPPGSAAVEPPVVTVTPGEDLVDGQVVEVAVTGADPGGSVFTRLCVDNAGGTLECAVDGGRYGTADEQGAVTYELGVEALIERFNAPSVDCRTADCYLDTAVGDENSTHVRSPITFRPDAPLLPRPSISLDPPTDLVDGSVVRVTGTGFVPFAPTELVQCRAPFTGYEDCEPPRTYLQAQRDGSFTADVDLVTIVSTADNEDVDCRLTACVLVATRNLFLQWPSRHTATAELAFRPDGPLRPPPVLTVDPRDALVEGSSVHVTGTGFRPGGVRIAQCSAATPGFEGCSRTMFVEAGADGTIDTTLTVGVLLSVVSGFTYCREAPGCVIAAYGESWEKALVEVPLTFDVTGPEPVLPSLTVGPSVDLATRSPALVAGSGFPPGDGMTMSQCRIQDGLPRECAGLGSQFPQVDANGNFFTGVILRAVISGPNGGEIDCRRVTCAVVAQPHEAYPGIAPITFEGSPSRPRRYLAPVFDDVEITEGVVYRHTTNSRGEAIDLALDIYRPAGDTATKRPAVMWMFGGYFGSGERKQLGDLASAMARRGYVSIAIDYRIRPEIFSEAPGCLRVGGACLDPAHFAGAMLDARDDARAAMVWLHEHASEYGIAPDAITAAGWSAGAITALNLAHDATGERAADSVPAAAISLAGILMATPGADDPPSMMLGGSRDSLLAMPAQIAGCGIIEASGSSCEFVGYTGAPPPPETDHCVELVVPCTYVLSMSTDHGFFVSERTDVTDRISRFLAREVLAPAGLLPDRPPHKHPHHRPHHRPHRHHHHHGHHDHNDRHHDDHGRRHGHGHGRRG